MKTFTDDYGNKFELVPYEMTSKQLYRVDGELYEAKPVAKPVEKQTVRVRVDNYYPMSKTDYYSILMELTEPQAEALAAAIQALVEYVQDDKLMYLNELLSPGNYIEAFNAARRAFQAGGDE